MQASNFGGTFDQLFLWIFSWNFHRKCLCTFSIPWCKKVKNDQKLKSRGGPALIPKTIGNRKKRLCVRLRSGDKHHLRKSSDRKAQIRKAFIPLTRLINFFCAFRSEDFLRWCLSTERNLTHNLFFLYPRVFGINFIQIESEPTENGYFIRNKWSILLNKYLFRRYFITASKAMSEEFEVLDITLSSFS